LRDHRRLDAFRLADELVMKAYRATESFPSSERYGLVGQIRRSATSGATNIVEGSARSSTREYRRFVEVAFGSVRELGYLLDLARRLNYLSDPSSTELDALQSRTAAALAALLRALTALN
jgi:four helix bundle protein